MKFNIIKKGFPLVIIVVTLSLVAAYFFYSAKIKTHNLDKDSSTTAKEDMAASQQAEIENLKKEIEDLKNKPAETQSSTSKINNIATPLPIESATATKVPQNVIQEASVITKPVSKVTTTSPDVVLEPKADLLLKIAKCQAKRDADYSALVSKVDLMIADAVQKIKGEAVVFMKEQVNYYDSCLIKRPAALMQYDSTMTPYELCSFYMRNVEAKKTSTDQLVEKTKASRNDFLSQGKAVTDSQYSQCINQ